MPAEILNEIFKDFDFKKIIQLRQVCQRIQSYVDTTKPDFGMKYIIISAITGGFVIHFGKDMVMEYKKQNHLKSVTVIDGDDEMWRPLETVLAHQKSVLEMLLLHCSLEENVDGYGKILEKVQTYLTARNCKQLQVKNLKLEAQTVDQILCVLPYLDPVSLNSMEFMDVSVHTCKPDRPIVNLEQIRELKQWKMAKEVKTKELIFVAKLMDFEHFDVVWEVEIDSFRMSELEEMKEKLFEEKSKKILIAKYSNVIEDAELPSGQVSSKKRSRDYGIPNHEPALVQIGIKDKRVWLFRNPSGFWI